jgi:hypothetical protein
VLAALRPAALTASIPRRAAFDATKRLVISRSFGDRRHLNRGQ